MCGVQTKYEKEPKGYKDFLLQDYSVAFSHIEHHESLMEKRVGRQMLLFGLAASVVAYFLKDDISEHGYFGALLSLNADVFILAVAFLTLVAIIGFVALRDHPYIRCVIVWHHRKANFIRGQFAKGTPYQYHKDLGYTTHDLTDRPKLWESASTTNPVLCILAILNSLSVSWVLSFLIALVLKLSSATLVGCCSIISFALLFVVWLGIVFLQLSYSKKRIKTINEEAEKKCGERKEKAQREAAGEASQPPMAADGSDTQAE